MVRRGSEVGHICYDCMAWVPADAWHGHDTIPCAPPVMELEAEALLDSYPPPSEDQRSDAEDEALR
jgi:hypothetical protein